MSGDLRQRTALGPTAVLLSGAAACAYLYGTDPHQPGHVLPVCPFRWLTGWQCPACGGTRMAYDLLHGDLARAWHDNALLLLLTPVLLGLLGAWAVAGWSGRRLRLVLPAVLPRYGGWVVLGVALSWTLLRNLA